MGFSPGDFKDQTTGHIFHLEGSPGSIKLWDEHESQLILRLGTEEARKMLDHLEMLVEMLEAGGL